MQMMLVITYKEERTSQTKPEFYSYSSTAAAADAICEKNLAFVRLIPFLKKK